MIQATQPILVTMQIGEVKYKCHMVSLSDEELQVSCGECIEPGSPAGFVSAYFRGEGVINHIKFDKRLFTYTLKIKDIQFQPGLLINTIL